jgi:hypothetical protein
VTDHYGTAALRRHDDGTITVERADDVILVSTDLLAETGHYVDGVLKLDTAGEYRYRRLRAHDQHADVFERIR